MLWELNIISFSIITREKTLTKSPNIVNFTAALTSVKYKKQYKNQLVISATKDRR